MNAVAPPGLGSVAVARALSLGLAPPTAEGVERLAGLVAALACSDLPGPLAGAAATLDEAIAAGVGIDELQADYETLFGIAGVCAPYEGAYERDPFRETRQLSDVAGFYAAFGATTGGPATDRPDHAGCELEFLAFLGLRRLAAEERGDAEEAELCRIAEDDFLRDHLGRFLPRLCDEIAGIAVAPAYVALARLGAAYAAFELSARGVAPRPVGDRRRRSGPVEADELACGDSCGLPVEQALHQITRKGGAKKS